MSWADYGILSNDEKYFRLNSRAKHVPVDEEVEIPSGYMEGISAAFNERSLAVDQIGLGYNKLLPTKNVRSVIDSDLPALVSSYINHTTNGGDYTGLSDLPRWTVADIMTYLGKIL